MHYTYRPHFRGPGFVWLTIGSLVIHLTWSRYSTRPPIWFTRKSKYAG